MNTISCGYTGQRRSTISSSYLLGNGYRGYNPVIKRFAGQDTWSPFGLGGVNGFAYCAGDPVNRTDPSGHLFWQLFVMEFGSMMEFAGEEAAEVEVINEAVINEAEVAPELHAAEQPENPAHRAPTLTELHEDIYDEIFSYFEEDSLDALSEAIPECSRTPDLSSALARRYNQLPFERVRKLKRGMEIMLNAWEAGRAIRTPGDRDFFSSMMVHTAWIYSDYNLLPYDELRKLYLKYTRDLPYPHHPMFNWRFPKDMERPISTFIAHVGNCARYQFDLKDLLVTTIFWQ